MNTLDVNTINMRNAYPTGLGNTTGIAGSANNQTGVPYSRMSQVPNTGGAVDSPEVSHSLSVGGQANPVIGGIVFLALIVGLAFLEEFRNIRVSPYNVLIVSMAAIIGMPIWKYVFTKFPVPGVSTWVASA
jgi:hypothetical protein